MSDRLVIRSHLIEMCEFFQMHRIWSNFIGILRNVREKVSNINAHGIRKNTLALVPNPKILEAGHTINEKTYIKR